MTATGTVHLHRVLRAPGERIYRAFTTPEALAKWLPPFGFFATIEHLDARVGGRYLMSFTNLSTGQRQSFGGEYLELTPGEHLRYTAEFDDRALPGKMQTTVSLRHVACGTSVSITQEGIPHAIPTEMCYLGWQESLLLLAQLVEADVPG